MRIQHRILVVVGGLLSLALAVVNLGVGQLLGEAQLEESANHLQIQALLAARYLEDPVSGYVHELEEGDYEELPHLASWASQVARRSGATVLVTDPTGRPLAGLGQLTDQELSEAVAGRPLHRLDSQQVYALAPIVRLDSTLGVVRLAVPKDEAQRRSHRLRLQMGAVSLATLVLALLGGVALSRRLTGPLRQLEQSALRAAAGEWDTSVEVQGQDELASLATAFTTMLAELRASVERQRRFIGDASHELRTPLTRMKLRTETLLDGGLEDEELTRRYLGELDDQIDRLTRLANTLLDLSRLEEARPGQTLEVAQALQRAVEAVSAQAQQRQTEVVVTLEPDLPRAPLSAQALELLTVNLLDNAIKYSPEGSRVELRAQAEEAGLRLEVIDNGPGLAAEHRDKIFERFYRVDEARSAGGGGLGLALVKAAVESAGGSVSVESEPDQGCRFLVWLPVSG
ncbi:MAG: HAMP domain-containing protein [Candidatus Eremiobacteraeota bacterium]|nr:HAMP domain-containing protein [Candidatus Eremiobacteraeota bacterium]